MGDGPQPGGRRYIAQGEQAIGEDPGLVISTILGSCVSACLWDPVRGVGGMNHILVPDGGSRNARALSVGATAMETLINALMKSGAQRDRLVAKVFGGASIVAGLSDIGERNTAFVFDYLRLEGIQCQSSSVGGHKARQIRFWPATGRVQQRLVMDANLKEDRADAPAETNGLELL